MKELSTQILSGETVEKDSPVIEALGACRELTCRLGIAKLHVPRFKATINRFQRSLVSIFNEISSKGALKYEDIDKEMHFLAVQIEEYGRDIGDKPYKDIIPGNNLPSAELHAARAACRQLERRLVTLFRSGDLNIKLIKYINKLSDVIYLMAVTAEDMDNINLED